MTTTTSTYSPLSYFGYYITTSTPTPFITTTTTTTTTPTPTPTIVTPTITFSYNNKTVKELTINVGDSIVLTYYVNNPSRLNLYYEHYNSNSYAASSTINYGYFVINANHVGSTLVGITLKTGVVTTVGGGNVKVNVIDPATTTPYLTTTTSTTSTTYIPTPTPTQDDLSNYGIKAFNLCTDNSYVSYANGYTRIYPNIVIVPENSYNLIKSVDYFIDNPHAISFAPDKPLYNITSDDVSPIDVYNLNNCSEDTPNTITAYAKLVNGFTKVSTITLTVKGQPKPTLSPYEKSLVDKLANHISQILFDKDYQ